jgi:hypothetical protein
MKNEVRSSRLATKCESGIGDRFPFVLESIS